MTLLSIQNCGIRFGGITALKGFHCDMQAGELLGVIGPNGAGKTTLFNLLTGIYMPTEGQIQFQGRVIEELKPFQLCRLGIARTFQNIRLFGHLTVEENVLLAMNGQIHSGFWGAALSLRSYQQEAGHARLQAQKLLAEFRLETIAGRGAKTLPYGDQRKVEIVRALATRPKLLLLDEPAAGMNATEKRELMAFIQHIHRDYGLAIILIEHDMHVVMNLCPRLIVLDYGQIIAKGEPAEIKKNPRVIEAYLGVKPVC